MPERRRAGKPKRKPTSPATSPAIGIVQMSVMSLEKVCDPSFRPWSEIRIAVV